ncbi:MAG TPA: hypothetical protein VE270_06225, partial [Thermoleophilaceae bacterium]|nr:hypothetical protein [Thermoleophilaceae bacterium]
MVARAALLAAVVACAVAVLAAPVAGQERSIRKVCVETRAGNGGFYTVGDLNVTPRNGRCKRGAQRITWRDLFSWMDGVPAGLRGP